MNVSDLPWKLAAKIEDRGAHWIWTAARDRHGYGRVNPCYAGTQMAHRAVYILLVGDPGPSLELDHLCRIPSCVRPGCLEPVTHATNVRRGISGEIARAHYAKHLTCPAGHPLAGENLYLYIKKSGVQNKMCRICRRETKRARRAAGAKD